MKQLLADIKKKPIFWLGIFIPIVLVLHFIHFESPNLIFVFSLLAIVPLAAFLSHATEGVAAKTGDTVGGLLNATLGNLTELVIFFALLRLGDIELVKASIAGAVVTNSLFMLGMSFVLGGIKFRVQEFNRMNSFIQTSLLFIICVALLVPSIITRLSPESASASMSKISVSISVILMLIYLLNLLFSLKTHSDFFKSAIKENKQEEEHHWPFKTSLIVLGVSAVCIAIVSEIFVGGIEEVSKSIGLPQAFVGFIVIPVVGAAAEMMAAFSAAKKNKLDISVSIAMGSSVQIALFITPLLVFLSYFVAPAAMDLNFRGGLIFMMLFATLTVTLIANHGKSTWYLGVLLLAVFCIFALTLFFL